MKASIGVFGIMRQRPREFTISRKPDIAQSPLRALSLSRRQALSRHLREYRDFSENPAPVRNDIGYGSARQPNQIRSNDDQDELTYLRNRVAKQDAELRRQSSREPGFVPRENRRLQSLTGQQPRDREPYGYRQYEQYRGPEYRLVEQNRESMPKKRRSE